MSPGWKMTDCIKAVFGGAGRVRTGDPLLAKQVLYQLSYDPNNGRVMYKRTTTLRNLLCAINRDPEDSRLPHRFLRPSARLLAQLCRLLRKEVIQPQVPLRLPCYDFVPITSLTLGRRLHCWLANALRAKPAFMT